MMGQGCKEKEDHNPINWMIEEIESGRLTRTRALWMIYWLHDVMRREKDFDREKIVSMLHAIRANYPLEYIEWLLRRKRELEEFKPTWPIIGGEDSVARREEAIKKRKAELREVEREIELMKYEYPEAVVESWAEGPA